MFLTVFSSLHAGLGWPCLRLPCCTATTPPCFLALALVWLCEAASQRRDCFSLRNLGLRSSVSALLGI